MTYQQDIEAGRRFVICYSVAVIGLSFTTILQFNLLVGTQRLPQQLVRFLLTIWLCVSVYQGSQLARSLWILLGSIAGVMMIHLVLTDANMDWVLRGCLVIHAATYLAFAAGLFGSPKVKAFLSHQNQGKPAPAFPHRPTAGHKASKPRRD